MAGFYAPFDIEVAEFSRSLPCKWTHGASHPLEGQNYNYGCHGGNWGSVSLLVATAPNQPEYIDNVRLIWRNWSNETDPRITDADTAQRFVNAVASHFIAPAEVVEVTDKFMRGEKMGWRSGNMQLTISTHQIGGETIHRLEIATRGAQLASTR